MFVYLLIYLFLHYYDNHDIIIFIIIIIIILILILIIILIIILIPIIIIIINEGPPVDGSVRLPGHLRAFTDGIGTPDPNPRNWVNWCL